MKPIKSILLLLFIIGLGHSNIFAQTLDDYINEGLENNLLLQQREMDVKRAMQQLKESKGLFLPDVSVASDYTLADGGRLISFPIGDLFNPIYGTLNQLTGTNQFPTDLENVNEQFFLNRFHDTRLVIAQPLFNTDIYYSYKANQALMSVQEAQLEAYQQELKKEIRVAYHQYAKTQDLLNILGQNKRLVEELVQTNESLVRNQKATVDAVYRARFELSKIDRDIADANLQDVSAQSYFNFLLNRPLQSEINLTDTDEIPVQDVTSIQMYIDQAISDREELDQLRSGLDARKELLNLNRASRLPKASVGILAGYQGFDYRFTDEEDYQLIQFNVTVPIFSGFQRNARIQKAKIDFKQTQSQLTELEQQIKLQVIQAEAALNASYENYYAAESQLASAEKVFEIKDNQYKQGQLILVDFLDAQTQLITAQNQLSISRSDVWIKKAELERILSM